MLSAVCIDFVPVRPSPEPTIFSGMRSPRIAAPTLARRRGEPQCVETLAQVGDQVLRVLEPDVQANEWAGEARVELPLRQLVARRYGEALEAAPGEPKPEQGQPIEHGVDGGGRHRLEDHAEQAVAAGEVPSPERVVTRSWMRRV